MRTAIISDIHGHFDTLQTVLHDIENQRCDRILCLGDSVDGGSHSAEVVQLLRDQNILSVRGNHDEFPSSILTRDSETAASILSRDAQEFLRALPETLRENDVVFTHISPRAKQTPIQTDFDAWNVFDDTAQRLAFFGHIHIPAIWGQKCSQPVSATSYEVIFGQAFHFDSDDRYLVCVGAVGQTRNWCPWPRYVVYDAPANSVTFYAPAI